VSKKRLGRGLDALLSGTPGTPGPDLARAAPAPADLGEVEISDIVRGRYQPRREFAEEALAELAASIKSQGVMQPVVLRPRPQGGYELVAGERRWRAAQMAGLSRIPAVVRDVSDEQASAMALIENIQREDLNPLEEASALQRLKDEFSLTQQQVADTVGKSRVAVTNLLRLLNLAPAVRDMLLSGAIEMGHARAVLSLESVVQERVAKQVADKRLSVRQTESLVRQLLNGGTSATGKSGMAPKDADTKRLEREIADRVGAPVAISHSASGRGQMVIRYSSLDELDGILRHIRS
jgi:ParB family chromosome partitioning protein